MRMSKLLLFYILVCFPLFVNAQRPDTLRNRKFISNAQLVSVGYTNILDTYLSQEKYTGLELRYLSHTIREHEGSPWSRLLMHQGSFSTVESRSGDGHEMGGMYTFTYGLHYNWKFLSGKLSVRAGGQADVNVGFLYNTRNSNNLAQFRLGLNISPSAAVAYRFRIGKHLSALHYDVSVPLLGIRFSPNYGQSYYEIFNKDNYDHNVVPTTIVSTPSLWQLLTFDFTLHRTTFRLGYLGDFQQAKVNNLKYHNYSNMFVIGIVRQFNLTKVIP